MTVSPKEIISGLVESINWIAQQTADERSLYLYRSPVLMTALEYKSAFKPHKFNADSLGTIIANVVRQRRSLLESRNIRAASTPVDLRGGRLLRHNFGETTCTGVPRDLTNGFFDDYDVPGWDTWVAFVNDVNLNDGTKEDYLVSWIPPEIIEPVNEAVRSSFEENLLWLDKTDTELTRALPNELLPRYT